MNRYENTIRAQFFGHTHHDFFTVFRNITNSTNVSVFSHSKVNRRHFSSLWNRLHYAFNYHLPQCQSSLSHLRDRRRHWCWTQKRFLGARNVIKDSFSRISLPDRNWSCHAFVRHRQVKRSEALVLATSSACYNGIRPGRSIAIDVVCSGRAIEEERKAVRELCRVRWLAMKRNIVVNTLSQELLPHSTSACATMRRCMQTAVSVRTGAQSFLQRIHVVREFLIVRFKSVRNMNVKMTRNTVPLSAFLTHIK